MPAARGSPGFRGPREVLLSAANRQPELLELAESTASRHPKGLYQLFFTEMWERLAFYTMLNILLLYATDFERGGLGLTSAEGNQIYGLYLAFVYFTPFPGGMLADRYLGYRRAVAIGAVFMSAGLFMMSIPGQTYFVVGLISLIVGNGFFKPNISVMVGNLYEAGDPKRDAGFNIFYMGINIGAFVASFLSSAVRNDYGWLWTFRVAAIGLLIALVLLAFSWKSLEKADRKPEIGKDDAGFGTVFAKILVPALVTGVAGAYLAAEYLPASIPVRPPVAGFLVGMIPVIWFFVRMGTTAVPKEKPGLLALLPIYVAGGTFFMILHLNGSAMTQWARDATDREIPGLPGKFEQEALPPYYGNAGEDVPRPDPRSLLLVDDATTAKMYGQQRMDEQAVARVLSGTDDVKVVEIPPKAEQGGAFSCAVAEKDPFEELRKRETKVYDDGVVTVDEESDSHGAKVIKVNIPDGAKPTRKVAFVREVEGKEIGLYVIDDAVRKSIYETYRERYGHPPELLPPGEYLAVGNPELYQSFNALFVVAFTPLVVMFFAWMARRKRDVTTARKVFYGLVLTTLSMLLMAAAGAMSDDGAVKVSGLWLVGFYGIVTIGELFLSPMGLSLVTKLTPKRLVGLAMGGWFMATAFGNNLSGFFGGIQSSLSPVLFFLVLAGLAGASAAFIYILLPRLEAALKQYGA